MKHIPYGYRINGGKAVIEKEEAEILLKITDNFLSGMSYKASAEKAGFKKHHSLVKQLLSNPKYYNDAFYPAIIDTETAKRISEEIIKREKKRKPKRKKQEPSPEIYVNFVRNYDELVIDDPIKQAEYAYSLIESVVNEK